MNNPGAALAAMRRNETKRCAHCGASFTAIRTARYCSERCKQAAKYRRKKEVS